MSQHPRAGQPAQPDDLVDIPALAARVRRHPARPVRSRPSGSRSGRPGTAARRSGARSTRPTSSPRPRRSAATGPAQGYTGPLFIGRDTHALSEPAWRTALEVLVANGVDVRVDAADGYTPTPGRVPRDPRREPRPRPRRRTGAGPRGRDRRDAVAQPARRRRLQVQPAQRRPGRHRRDALDPGRGEPDPRGGGQRRPRRHPAPAVRAGAGRRRRLRLPRPATSTTSARSSTWPRSRTSGLRIGVDPLGGAAVGVLGRDRRALRPRPHGHQRRRSTRRSAFMTLDWDGKIRMDPSSPFAMAGLVELRDRFDLALGNDADADRHGVVVPGRRAHEPQPRARGGDLVPVRRRARVGRARSRSARRSCQLVDHRPGRRRPRPAAARGPGRVQVVRRRARRRVGRVRRRGERRGVVPAPRRHASGRPTRTGSSRACSRRS